MSAEESSTSKTGGRKITKPQQFSLIPPGPLWELAEHFAKGSEKYGAHNVRKGYEWSKMYDAAMRHLTQFWAGEDRDEETGSKHLAAVAFYALLLMEFMETHREYDDRYKSEEQVTRTTQESYDAWDAGRPFGRFPYPIDAMPINRDKDKQ